MKVQLIPMFASVFLAAALGYGQAVNVTLQADQTTLLVGHTTVLRVFGQIDPALASQSEQIFSFYIDLLNPAGQSARPDYGLLAMPNCDNFAGISSAGSTDGAHRRGIFNTFMNRPGAGKLAPVELLNVPLAAVSAGTVTFAVSAGTTVPDLAHDFIVATTNVGSMLTGGNYAAAQASLTVHAAPSLTITLDGGQARLDYPAWADLNYYVEYQDNLDPGQSWGILPGGPHNSGRVFDPLGSNRFYRLRILCE